MDDTSTPLARLLSDARARGFGPAKLCEELKARGIVLTISGVSLWYSGGGIADKHRAAVAEVIGVPLPTLLLAAAGVETGDSQREAS